MVGSNTSSRGLTTFVPIVIAPQPTINYNIIILYYWKLIGQMSKNWQVYSKSESPHDEQSHLTRYYRRTRVIRTRRYSAYNINMFGRDIGNFWDICLRHHKLHTYSVVNLKIAANFTRVTAVDRRTVAECEIYVSLISKIEYRCS